MPLWYEIARKMNKQNKPVQPTLQATEGTVTAMTVIHKDIMGKEQLYLVLHKNDGKDREVVNIGASTFERISKLLMK